MEQQKQRVIQEYVPGKQVTLAHVIANPVPELYQKLGIVDVENGAIGILTITPSEASIIAADVATKAGAVELAFVDRFSGSLVIYGDVQSVESSLLAVVDMLCGKMRFSATEMTRS